MSDATSPAPPSGVGAAPPTNGEPQAANQAAALADAAYRFNGHGVTFKAKIIGTEKVPESRGDAMCQFSMQKLKNLAKQTGGHKQKVALRINFKGLHILDLLTQEVLHEFPVNRMSFISRDPTDARAFGCVVTQGEGDSLFYAIKTEKSSEAVVFTLRDLFQAVMAQKKQAAKEMQSGAGAANPPANPQAVATTTGATPVSVASPAKAAESGSRQDNSQSPQPSQENGVKEPEPEKAKNDLLDLNSDIASLQMSINQTSASSNSIPSPTSQAWAASWPGAAPTPQNTPVVGGVWPATQPQAAAAVTAAAWPPTAAQSGVGPAGQYPGGGVPVWQQGGPLWTGGGGGTNPITGVGLARPVLTNPIIQLPNNSNWAPVAAAAVYSDPFQVTSPPGVQPVLTTGAPGAPVQAFQVGNNLDVLSGAPPQQPPTLSADPFGDDPFFNSVSGGGTSQTATAPGQAQPVNPFTAAPLLQPQPTAAPLTNDPQQQSPKSPTDLFAALDPIAGLGPPVPKREFFAVPEKLSLAQLGQQTTAETTTGRSDTPVDSSPASADTHTPVAAHNTAAADHAFDSSDNFFDSDPFGGEDPFGGHDPFADQSKSKDDPFASSISDAFAQDPFTSSSPSFDDFSVIAARSPTFSDTTTNSAKTLQQPVELSIPHTDHSFANPVDIPDLGHSDMFNLAPPSAPPPALPDDYIFAEAPPPPPRPPSTKLSPTAPTCNPPPPPPRPDSRTSATSLSHEHSASTSPLPNTNICITKADSGSVSGLLPPPPRARPRATDAGPAPIPRPRHLSSPLSSSTDGMASSVVAGN